MRVKCVVPVFSALTLLVYPASAQQLSWGSFGAGLVFPTGTTNHHVKLTFGITCSPFYTGVCVDAGAGGDFIDPLYPDVFYGDIGYSIAFGAEHPTSILPRVGVELWTTEEHGAFAGVTAGIALRHAITRKLALSVDYAWRKVGGFTLPTVSASVLIRFPSQ